MSATPVTTAPAAPYRLSGVKGWGSTITEAMLALCATPFEFDDVDGFDQPDSPAHARLAAVNPRAQVPTLVLPDGTVMTESAAIALLLAERFPAAGLAPAPGVPERAVFLRWLVWLVANVYPTFTFADYPARWVEHEQKLLVERVGVHREALWRDLEAALPLVPTGCGGPGSEGGDDTPWLLGGNVPSALDVYVTAMHRWRPRAEWFAAHCPQLHAVALRGDAHPVIGAVMRRNFPG